MLIFLLLATVHAEPFMIYPEKGIGKIECSGECDYMDKVHCTGCEYNIHHLDMRKYSSSFG